MESNGWILVRQNGSHAQFRNEDGSVITIKKDSVVKAVYVRDVLQRIKLSDEKNIKKMISEYMAKPYTRVVYPVKDESGTYYVGSILEFDGCQTTGSSLEEVFHLLDEAMEGWLEVKLSYGDKVPEPIASEEYSGRFVLRIPSSLHRRLAMEAKLEHLSLNQYALYKLTQ